MLESCKYVDEVVVFEENTPLTLIKRLNPDIIVKGGDYTKSTIVGSVICEVRIFNFINGYSTTNVIERIKT